MRGAVTAEDGADWTSFLRGPAARKPTGIRPTRGLVDAIRLGARRRGLGALPTHHQLDLLPKVPHSAQPLMATLVRSIFAPDADLEDLG